MIVPGSEDYYYSYTTMIAEYNAMRDMQSYIGKLHSLQLESVGVSSLKSQGKRTHNKAVSTD